MCPLMSLAATILFKNAGSQFIAVWIQTTAMNFPAAFFWQLIYAGPIVRFIFRHIFRENERVQDAAVSAEKASYYKRKTAQKIWSAGITKDFLYDQIFVCTYSEYPSSKFR